MVFLFSFFLGVFAVSCSQCFLLFALWAAVLTSVLWYAGVDAIFRLLAFSFFFT